MQTEFNDHDAETVNDAIRAIRANTGIDLFPASSMSVTELNATELYAILSRFFDAEFAAKLSTEARTRLGG